MVKIELHHVGIIVKNLDEAKKFFVENLQCKEFSPPRRRELPELGLRYELVASDNTRLELLEWKGKKEGVYEVAFKVDDIEKVYDHFKKKGITLTDMDGKPLADKKYVISPLGNRYAYLPKMFGDYTMIEVVQHLAYER